MSATPILEVETDKIAGAVEATDAGMLRRRVGEADTVYPVKALLGVIADASRARHRDRRLCRLLCDAGGRRGRGRGRAANTNSSTSMAGRLRYAKRGEGGETVILIHGFGGDLDNWLFNIDALAESATVYALDLPGHGQSVKIDRRSVASRGSPRRSSPSWMRSASRRRISSAIRWAAPSPWRSPARRTDAGEVADA